MLKFSVPPSSSNLELIANQAVEGFIIGLHKSPFHGFSVEFAEHRQYNQGDNLKHIDWRVWGRSEKLFVKKFEEETNLRCFVVLDTSSSMHFPIKEQQLSKLQYACVSAACVFQLLKRQLDASALITFDNRIRHFSECRSNGSHYRQLIQHLGTVFGASSTNQTTQIASCLHEIAEKIHQRSLVVVFSDMIDDETHFDAVFDALRHLRHNKHEIILFHILDKQQELEFDFENKPYEFVDLETGERVKLQAAQQKNLYKTEMERFRNRIVEKCYQHQISRVEVDLSESVEKILHTFLLKRNNLK